MVHQIEACRVGIGNLNKVMTGMVILPLAAFGSAAIEVHGQRSYCLGEDPDTGPDRREVQRTLLSDIGPADSIRHCVGRDHMIDRCLEFGCRHVAPLAPMQK